MIDRTSSQILTEVQHLLDAIAPRLAGTSQADMVRLGADLWAIAAKLTALTEGVKAKLREAIPSAPGQYTLNGPGAVCHATVPQPKPALRKDADLVALKQMLGPDFYRVFQDAPVLVDDLERGLQMIHPQNYRVVLNALDLPSSKARMSFQRKEASHV